MAADGRTIEEPYVIEKSFTVHGGGLQRRVVIPARDIREHDGMTFMHVSCDSILLFAGLRNQEDRRPLSKTDVVERLTALRTNAVMGKPCQKKVEELQTFKTNLVQSSRDPHRNSAAKRIKRSLDSVHKDIEVIIIQCPTLGDARGIEMKILKEIYRPTAPLYVELDSDNIAYLRNVCQWQIQHGNFKRHKTQKKVEGSVDVESECDHMEHDVERAKDTDAPDRGHEELGVEQAKDTDADHDSSIHNDADLDDTPSPPNEDRELTCDKGLETPVKKASTLHSFFIRKSNYAQ